MAAAVLNTFNWKLEREESEERKVGNIDIEEEGLGGKE